MSSLPDLTQYSAATFDVYGTIINWEPEIADFLQAWTSSQGQDRSRDELLTMYDRLRQPIQDLRPAYRYPEVLRKTLDAMTLELNCELPASLREEFGEIAGTHKPFPDSRDALLALKERGLKLGALSNIDEESFSRMLKTLDVEFDVVVTAQRVGAYKPDKAHFMAALSDMLALGIPQSQVLHIAQSRRADVVPANEIGLSCVWVNRQGHKFGRSGAGAEDCRPDFEVPSLKALVDESV